MSGTTTISTSVTGPITLSSPDYPGALTITSTGTVTGQSESVGIELDASILTNAGTVIGGAGSGIGIDIDGGTLLNTGRVIGGAGDIFGGAGVAMLHGGAFTNNGLIKGGGGIFAGGSGVELDDGATLTNHGTVKSGTASEASGTGVDIAGASTLINYGLVAVVNGYYIGGNGVDLDGAGVVINASHGTISGGGNRLYGGDGIFSDATVAGFIENKGVIHGGTGELYGGEGVVIGSAGTVINAGGIAGGSSSRGVGGYGVGLQTGATLINTGSIQGGSLGYTLVAEPSAGAGVVDSAGVILNFGAISAGNGYSYPSAGHGKPAGGIGGIGGAGADLIGGTIANAPGGLIKGGAGGAGTDGGTGGVGVDISGAASALSDAGTIIGGAGGYGFTGQGGDGGNGAYLNGGTLDVDGGTLIGGAAGVAGTAAGAPAHAGYAVDFGNIAGDLILGDNAVLLGGIAGFAAGDTIDLSSVIATSESFVNGTLSLSDTGTIVDRLVLAEPASFTSGSFLLGSDHALGTDITVECFLAGTAIATEHGARPVESLRVGERVITLFGGTQEIRAVERRQYAIGATTGSDRLRPVKIAAGALGRNLPVHDLYVSPDHALYLQGVLVPAHLLIDGVAITQPRIEGPIYYYHVEVDPHDVIFAEGVATETYLNIGKGSGYHDHGAGSRMPAEPKTWEDACAPLVLGGPALAAILAELSADRNIRLGTSLFAEAS